MIKSLLPLVAIAVLGVTGPALANDSDETSQQLIRYNTASLNQPEARRILMLRIERAARNLCGSPVMGSKEEADGIRACRDKAMAMAIAQVPVNMASSN
jgi:UrcA family protein